MTAAHPPHWPVYPLTEVAELTLGKMLDRAKRTAGRPLPYLRNINVRWGHFELSDLLQMPFEENELERYGLRKGDVLICEGGEPGRAAVWPGSANLILFQKALHRVRCTRALEPQWLAYQLKHDAEQGLLSRRFTGTTIKHFTGSALREYPVALPPLNEQRRIIAKLEALFAGVGRARGALAQVTALGGPTPPESLLARLEASILAKAFRGELVPQDAADAPTSALLQQIPAERLPADNEPSSRHKRRSETRSG
ncbi:hypothetical protein D7Y27_30940 [Corallococcus sp. AB004]|nr:hypothetical protein D7Y27_30940 [Corallococcus sp. AB004]